MDWKIKKQPSVLFMAFIEIPSDQELYNKLENKHLPPQSAVCKNWTDLQI